MGIHKVVMKLVSVLPFLGLTAASSQWESFKKSHNKIYASRAEEQARYLQFQSNLKFIEEHNLRYNLGLQTFTVGVNAFADMHPEEFEQTRLMDLSSMPSIQREYKCSDNFQSSGSNPDSVDWTTTANPKNTVAVTAVKNQGSCGSCWSFGAVASFEGQECLAGQQKCSTWKGASEQQLVDCDASTDSDLGNYYCSGCNGGWPSNAFYYIQVNGGIDSETSYPYTSGTSGKTGTCNYSSKNSVGRVTGCGSTASGNEDDLADAIAEVGPIAIGIDASGLAFQLYSGGIYTSDRCSSTRLNHAVTAVGYGSAYTSSGNDEYFLIKNSWGTSWGMNGYIQIARNDGNMCGVATDASYPSV